MWKKKKRNFFVIHFLLSRTFLSSTRHVLGRFKKAINRAGASVIVKDVDKTMDKDFDVEERRYKTLKTAGTNLQKAAKGYLDNIRAITNSQVTMPRLFITCTRSRSGDNRSTRMLGLITCRVSRSLMRRL